MGIIFYTCFVVNANDEDSDDTIRAMVVEASNVYWQPYDLIHAKRFVHDNCYWCDGHDIQ